MAAEPTAELRKQLLALPGVGQETADAILLYAFGHPIPVADSTCAALLCVISLLTFRRAMDATRHSSLRDRPLRRSA